jgi:hypothetical protein
VCHYFSVYSNNHDADLFLSRVEQQLQVSSRLSGADYGMLAVLSEAPEGQAARLRAQPDDL